MLINGSQRDLDEAESWRSARISKTSTFNGGHFHKIVQAIYTRAITIEHNNG